MASTIITIGTSPEPITTRREAGESLDDWIRRHAEALQWSTPSGEKLLTTWPSLSARGVLTTVRRPGESDQLFKQRHLEAYPLHVAARPPLP